MRSTTNIFDLIEQATLSFAKTSKILRNVNHKGLPLTFQNFNREVLKSAGNNNLTYLINSKINLNPSQITFLNELDNVISNLEIGLELTIEKIKKIELDIISQCSVDEAKILLSATSVARYSLEYWTENYEKWIIELGGMEIGAMNELKSISSRGGWDWFCDTLIRCCRRSNWSWGWRSGRGCRCGVWSCCRCLLFISRTWNCSVT